MLKQVLFRYANRKQLFVAVIGTLIGFVFLLCAIHYFVASRSLGEGNEILGGNVLIAQRKVSKFDALSLGTNTFEQAEIEKLRSLSFVKNVEPVINNRFNISLGMKEQGLPYFRTDVFVQSVKDELMDVKVDSWKWKSGDEVLPLVMPRDFMIMLNQFAASYGIPQVSEDLAMTFNFRIDISGNGKKEHFNARVVGFSNQISAILVPIEFMEYGNEIYSDDEPPIITQLMLSIEDGAYGLLESVMEEQNLDIKKNELTIAKVKSILSAVLGVILFVSVITIFLSALLIMQYTQILISKSDYEITTLLRIGYHPNVLSNAFLSYLIKLFGILFILSILLFGVIKFFLDQFLSSSGFPLPNEFEWYSIAILTLIVCVIIGLNYNTIKRLFIQRIYNT